MLLRFRDGLDSWEIWGVSYTPSQKGCRMRVLQIWNKTIWRQQSRRLREKGRYEDHNRVPMRTLDDLEYKMWSLTRKSLPVVISHIHCQKSIHQHTLGSYPWLRQCTSREEKKDEKKNWKRNVKKLFKKGKETDDSSEIISGLLRNYF